MNKSYERFSAPKRALPSTPGGAAEEIWRRPGPTPFVSKLMGLFMDMDKRVGRNFEDGLRNLRPIAEGQAS